MVAVVLAQHCPQGAITSFPLPNPDSNSYDCAQNAKHNRNDIILPQVAT
jgi:hypothetical protein